MRYCASGCATHCASVHTLNGGCTLQILARPSTSLICPVGQLAPGYCHHSLGITLRSTWPCTLRLVQDCTLCILVCIASAMMAWSETEGCIQFLKGDVGKGTLWHHSPTPPRYSRINQVSTFCLVLASHPWRITVLMVWCESMAQSRGHHPLPLNGPHTSTSCASACLISGCTPWAVIGGCTPWSS